MAIVLIIDDDDLICETLAAWVKTEGHTVMSAHTISEGRARLLGGAFDLVFLDVRLPDGNGLDILPEIQKSPSSPEVIIITGGGDADGAELAIKSGAWDYIQKPFSGKEILLQIARAMEYRQKKSLQKATVSLKRTGIIGNSAQLNASLDSVAQCANTDVNVLIYGETGTGKELFARAIHENSAKAGSNFVVVDCTVLPEQLVESVLFGHVKGAFTGATQAQEGLIRQADGGTLFLDEIGELPLAMQKSFLRVLQEKKFRPVGSNQEKTSNFRLVSATNRDLDLMASQGQFRQDLLFRLRSVTIEVPPLRSRPDDITPLVMHYLEKLCRKHLVDRKGVSPEFMEMLEAHYWPGNIRELISCLEQSILADPANPILYPKHLPDAIRISYVQSAVRKKRLKESFPAIVPDLSAGLNQIDPAKANQPDSLPSLKDYREKMVESAEAAYLKKLLKMSRFNIPQACDVSDLSRARLYALMKKYNISRDSLNE